MMDTLHQFKKQDYAKRLKAQITSESMPSSPEDLFGFLYDQIIHNSA